MNPRLMQLPNFSGGNERVFIDIAAVRCLSRRNGINLIVVCLDGTTFQALPITDAQADFIEAEFSDPQAPHGGEVAKDAGDTRHVRPIAKLLGGDTVPNIPEILLDLTGDEQ